MTRPNALEPDSPLPVLRPRREEPVGLLWRPPVVSAMRHMRYLPSPDLAHLVEHFWVVRWDLRGKPPFRQETLPHPSVHLVFEAGTPDDGARLFGVPHGRFVRTLSGRGRAVGIKFRPGGFRPLWPRPVHTLSGRSLPLTAAFGAAGSVLARDVAEREDPPAAADVRMQATVTSAATDDTGRAAEEARERTWPDVDRTDACLVGLLEGFVRQRLERSLDDTAMRYRSPQTSGVVMSLVDRIIRDRSIRTVESLAHVGAVSPRTLQRLFREHVGVSAKWVLCRQRLHEAASALQERKGAAQAQGAHVTDRTRMSWARLALDLGFYDQAHFVRSFTALVGIAPASYVRALTEASDRSPA